MQVSAYPELTLDTPAATFIDALGAVRRSLWTTRLFEMSVQTHTAEQLLPKLLELW
jgi:hypothetical protein